MPSTQMLLVLVVQEASLRSALIARLSIAGASLVTARDVRAPGLRSTGARPAVLVADEASVRGQELAALLEERHWHRIVVLTAATPPERDPQADPRLIFIRRDVDAARIAELVPGWEPGSEE